MVLYLFWRSFFIETNDHYITCYLSVIIDLSCSNCQPLLLSSGGVTKSGAHLREVCPALPWATKLTRRWLSLSSSGSGSESRLQGQASGGDTVSESQLRLAWRETMFRGGTSHLPDYYHTSGYLMTDSIARISFNLRLSSDQHQESRCPPVWISSTWTRPASTASTRATSARLTWTGCGRCCPGTPSTRGTWPSWRSSSRPSSTSRPWTGRSNIREMIHYGVL